MLVHTSVYTTSAPATAATGSLPISIRAPVDLASVAASSRYRGSGSYPGGVAIRSDAPVLAAHNISECATLLPSPTYAIATPRRSGPLCSRVVKVSARPWHGWDRSESPLMTGAWL